MFGSCEHRGSQIGRERWNEIVHILSCADGTRKAMDGECGAEIMQSRDVAVTRSRDSGHSTQATKSVPKVRSFDLAPALEAEQEHLLRVLAVRSDIFSKLAA